MKPDFMIEGWRSWGGKDSKPPCYTEEDHKRMEKEEKERRIEHRKEKEKWAKANGVKDIYIDDSFLESLHSHTSIWVKKEDFERTEEAIRVLKECVRETALIENIEEYEYG